MESFPRNTKCLASSRENLTARNCWSISDVNNSLESPHAQWYTATKLVYFNGGSQAKQSEIGFTRIASMRYTSGVYSVHPYTPRGPMQFDCSTSRLDTTWLESGAVHRHVPIQSRAWHSLCSGIEGKRPSN